MAILTLRNLSLSYGDPPLIDDYADLRVAEVPAVVADRHAAAQASQPPHGIAVGQVGTRHLEAQVGQDLGYPGHADTADADKMNMVFLQIHRFSNLSLFIHSTVLLLINC